MMTPPATTRSFFDPLTTRKWLLENAVQAFQTKLNTLESPTHKLRVSKVECDMSHSFTPTEQKQAILEKRNLTVPIHGMFELVRKDSGEVEAKKNTIIAHVPWLTERNTSVLNGSEYVTASQMRLKPGVYTRIKSTGEVEAHINVLPGSGLGGRVLFVPEKELFLYQVHGVKIKLYGLLHDLGVSDTELQHAWGADLLAKNKQQYSGDEIDKLYDKVFGRAE